MSALSRALRALALPVLVGLLALPAVAAAQPAALPQGWPSDQLQLGMRDDEGGATSLREATRLGIRYHYLSGGVNTGKGWTTWSQGGGSFVPRFIQDSSARAFLPVFSYYQIRESAPGSAVSDERSGMLNNLQSATTMKAYFEDLRLFFQKAGGTHTEAVLHVEPDLWGYIERQATNGDPSTVPAAVASTGLSELAGLPDNASGFAQAIVRLRDRYAKNVLLGYHLSVWGTGEDIADSDPSDAHVDDLAAKAAAFYQALHANFDLVFAEYADRDSAYQTGVSPFGDSRWWTDGDFARNIRFLGGVASTVGKRVVIWQIPVGNTLMSAVNNTNGHYQDNRVQWLLSGSTSRERLTSYADAGVIAFLFGPAQTDATCACDARGDGVTNPPAIDGNTRASLSSDDDGGLFKALANQYYKAGTIALPAAKVSGGPRAKRHAVKARFSVRARSAGSVRRGRTVKVTVRVRASAATRSVVAVQFYAPSAGRTPTGQVAFRGQTLRAGRAKTFTARFKVPRHARAGRWTVKVGVFDVDFKKLLDWSPGASSFTVR